MSDVFGSAIRAYFEGDEDAVIAVTIDDQEDEPIPVKTFFRNFEDMPEAEKLALESCSGRILDVGAAAGCHSLHLQDQGFEVIALDSSEGCCQVMNQRNIKNVVHGDFFNFEDEEGFDTILLLMNGLGIAGNIERSPVLFEKLKSLLKPGGKVLTDSSDLIYLYEGEDGSLQLPMEKYYGEVEFSIGFGETEKEVFPWVYLDPDILESTASECGWKVEFLAHGDHFDYLAELRLD